MKPKFTKFIVALMTAVLVIGSASSVMAQVKRKEDKEQKTKETVAMSQQVYEKLSEIQELIEAKDYATAEKQIVDLRGNKKLSDYERAQIWNITAYGYYLQERYAEAIAALMDDPEKRTYMGEYGRERMASLLCWEHVSRNLIIGYDRLFGIPQRINKPSPNLATLAAKNQDNTNLLSQKAM